MDEEILKLAKEMGIKIDPRFGEIYTGNIQLEAFYRAAYNKAIEDALYVATSTKCYYAINELEKKCWIKCLKRQ